MPMIADVFDGLFFVMTLAIPVLLYRLWAIDTVIRRSATYAVVTIAVGGGFAAIAAIGTAIASERVGYTLAAAAAVPGAVLPVVVSAVAGSLRLPYVAIERPGDGSVLAASSVPAKSRDVRA